MNQIKTLWIAVGVGVLLSLGLFAYRWINRIVYKITQTDGILRTVTKLIYQVFSSEYTGAFISVLGTIVIADMIGRQYDEAPFIILCILYIICVLLIAWANKYKKQRLQDGRILQQALHGINVTLRAWAIKLDKFNHKVTNNPSIPPKKEVSAIDFQTAAFGVCEKLSASLREYYNTENPDDIYVTVFQREKAICKMIAHSSDHDPSSLNHPYDIPQEWKEQLGKIEYHSYLFAKDSTEIAVLENKQKISEAFKPHENSSTREDKIEQYIGIPIAPSGEGVKFLLQIDTCVENLFGKKWDDVMKLARISMYPYAQFLHMIYEESMAFELSARG